MTSVIVSGDVDAENGFAALLRTTYMVTMKPTGEVTLAFVGGGG